MKTTLAQTESHAVAMLKTLDTSTRPTVHTSLSI